MTKYKIFQIQENILRIFLKQEINSFTYLVIEMNVSNITRNVRKQVDSCGSI